MSLTNVDLLTEDRPLANQKFVCISFARNNFKTQRTLFF